MTSKTLAPGPSPAGHCLRRPALVRPANGLCNSSRLWPGQVAAMRWREPQWRPAAQPKDLWNYESSCVQGLNLDTLKAVHRLSYGHRGRRSMLVVVYDPEHAACREAEAEVERLAAGLRRYPHIVVARVNLRTAHLEAGQKDSKQLKEAAPTAQFLASITDMSTLPVVLLYPEGTPGMMRYNVQGPIIAESLLTALNSCQSAVFPERPQMQLAQPRPATALPGQPPGPAAASAAAAPQGAQATTSSVSVGSSAVYTRPGSYWTPEKAWFWGGIATISVALLVWEKWLGPFLEMRAFRARQAARAADPDRATELFDEDINIEDLWRLKTTGEGAVGGRAARGAGGQVATRREGEVDVQGEAADGWLLSARAAGSRGREAGQTAQEPGGGGGRVGISSPAAGQL